jgi:hypothetical protein
MWIICANFIVKKLLFLGLKYSNAIYLGNKSCCSAAGWIPSSDGDSSRFSVIYILELFNAHLN